MLFSTKGIQMTSILSLDQSTSSTGYAVGVEGNLIDWGVIKTPSKLKGIDACWYQLGKIEDIMRDLDYDAVSLECLFMGSNGGPGGARRANPYIAFLLGEFRGMLRMTIHKYVDCQIDIATHDISVELGLKVTTPRLVKKRAARQRAASLIWQDRALWEKVPEDAADAIVMLQIAQKRFAKDRDSPIS
jgi:hypothetical protein